MLSAKERPQVTASHLEEDKKNDRNIPLWDVAKIAALLAKWM